MTLAPRLLKPGRLQVVQPFLANLQREQPNTCSSSSGAAASSEAFTSAEAFDFFEADFFLGAAFGFRFGLAFAFPFGFFGGARASSSESVFLGRPLLPLLDCLRVDRMLACSDGVTTAWPWQADIFFDPSKWIVKNKFQGNKVETYDN